MLENEKVKKVVCEKGRLIVCMFSNNGKNEKKLKKSKFFVL